jgi:hypothetical protein
MYRGLFVAVVVVATSLAIFIWASDRITLEGERTIYTVTCEQGTWDGLLCTGHLAAGDRHRFRASRSRHEIVYWIAGSRAPSGKYVECDVTDRDRWTCKATPGELKTIAHQLDNGRPVLQPGGSDLAFHAVSKWKWWVLDAGIPIVRRADFSSTFNPRRPDPAPTDSPPK